MFRIWACSGSSRRAFSPREAATIKCLRDFRLAENPQRETLSHDPFAQLITIQRPSRRGQKKCARTEALAHRENCVSGPLEDDLGGQLQVECFSRADSRRPVEVANRIAHRAITADGARARREIDSVE